MSSQYDQRQQYQNEWRDEAYDQEYLSDRMWNLSVQDQDQPDKRAKKQKKERPTYTVEDDKNIWKFNQQVDRMGLHLRLSGTRV